MPEPNPPAGNLKEFDMQPDSLPNFGQVKSSASRKPVVNVIFQLLKNKGAIISIVFLFLLGFVAINANSIAPYDPVAMSGREIFNSPGARHLLGTDQFGRDILSRIIHGTKYSLQLGFISVLISLLVGVPLGLVSGYYGKWLDNIIMRIMDIMLAFPGILLALVFVAILGPGLENATIAVGVAAIPQYTRMVRGSILSAKENVYVEAAYLIGCKNFRILFVHLLPNVFAPIIVISTMSIAWAIVYGASLSFLGLGAQPPSPEWGAMLSNGRDYLRGQWWIATFPGLAIMLVVLAINILGDGLRDALDPRLKM
jgi:peptide/nickel transport system permease protein